MSIKVDKNRRKFLKFLGMGGGALVLGKIFGGNFLDLLYGPSKTQEFDRFKVTETRNKFIISTKDGEDVFIMDDEK